MCSFMIWHECLACICVRVRMCLCVLCTCIYLYLYFIILYALRTTISLRAICRVVFFFALCQRKKIYFIINFHIFITCGNYLYTYWCVCVCACVWEFCFCSAVLCVRMRYTMLNTVVVAVVFIRSCSSPAAPFWYQTSNQLHTNKNCDAIIMRWYEFEYFYILFFRYREMMRMLLG